MNLQSAEHAPRCPSHGTSKEASEESLGRSGTGIELVHDLDDGSIARPFENPRGLRLSHSARKPLDAIPEPFPRFPDEHTLEKHGPARLHSSGDARSGRRLGGQARMVKIWRPLADPTEVREGTPDLLGG